MADKYTQTSTTGLGGRMANSVKGVIAGLLMIVVSFGLLYYNEGRAVKAGNMIKLAVAASTVDATNPDASKEGVLIAAHGTLLGGENLSDTVTAAQFNKGGVSLLPAPYLHLQRQVEMYAWKETKESKSSTNTGGSETTQTTYTYDKEWANKPMDSKNFNIPDKYVNPIKAVDDKEYVVKSATVGALALDTENLRLPGGERVALTSDSVELLPGTPASVIENNYIFMGKGTLEKPEIGDVRISYYAVPSGKEATVFGALAANTLKPFVDANNGSLYRAFFGTKDQAIVTMQSENSIITWALRLAGFLLMWFGLMAVFGPISTFLDILPVAGSVSRGLIAGVTFLVSLVVSVVVIVVGMIMHNVIAMLVAGVLAMLATFFVVKGVMKKKTT